jgi:hypothetical protein
LVVSGAIADLGSRYVLGLLRTCARFESRGGIETKAS